MLKFVIAVLAAGTLLAQSSTKVTIVPQQNDSATGVIDFREKYANGTNYVGWQAPANISSSFRLTLPSSLPTVAGCWQVSTSGITSIGTCASAVIASDYTWSQTIASITAGTRTITLAPCPLNASDTTWAFRVNDGVSSEVVFPTGIGTCTTGAATGTVQAIFLNSYTTPTASSASSGMQEAINSVADGSVVSVRAKTGSYNVYSSILTGGRFVSITCDGPGAVFYAQANNVAVFSAASPGGIRISGCALSNAYSKTGTTGIYTYNPTGNSFGTTIDDVSITGFAYGIHLGTAYAISLTRTKVVDATAVALWIEQVQTGDAGIGLISGNTFSDSVACPYGILWNGPGNLKVQGNSFNGYVEQIHLEETMGRVNVNGTAVTWVSGNKFRSVWGGAYSMVASSTVASPIASVTDSENLVLTTPQPVCNNCRYYVGNTGQMQIVNNTMDAGVNTTYGIRAVGDIPFYNFQITNNFFSNPAQTGHTGISIEGVGWYFGSVQANNLQTSVVGTTKAISLTAGNYITVANNQVVNNLTGINIGASMVGVKSYANNCTDLTNTTNCTLSAASTAIVQEISPMTFAQVTAMTAAAGSTMFCTDCKAAPTTNACVGSGSGAFVTFVQATKICRNANNPGSQFVFGGNAFGTTGIIGTNDAFGLGFKTNNTTHWTMQTDGSLYTATDGGPSIGAGGANRPLNGYFKGLVQAGTFGTAANCSDGTATPADCAAAAAGSVIISAGATAVVVNTTAVTASSQIFVLFDSSLGTKLGVTCNTTYAAPYVTARTAATSFTITVAGAPAANPACFSYFLAN